MPCRTTEAHRKHTAPHRPLLIYAFDHQRRPLRNLIAAFETLARTRVSLGERHEAPLNPLVHPVQQRGAVFAWNRDDVGVQYGRSERRPLLVARSRRARAETLFGTEPGVKGRRTGNFESAEERWPPSMTRSFTTEALA